MPMEAAHRNLLDLWCHLTLQSNGQDIARIIARKPVRFRRTAVPSPRCDLDGAVPIAKREVVELRRLSSIVSDLVDCIAIGLW